MRAVVRRGWWRPRVVAATACAGLLASPAMVTTADPTPVATADQPPCSAAVPWRELRYGASKLFLSATATLKVEEVVAAEAAGELLAAPPGQQLRHLPPCLVRLRVATDLPFGHGEEVTVWFDPGDGAAEQFSKLTSGGSPYQKIGRYTRDGYDEWRASPADHAEAARSPSRWTHRKSHYASWDDALPEGAVVTSPYALLYLLSSASLKRPQTPLHAYIFADGRLLELRFAVTGTTESEVDFSAQWPGGSRDEHRTARLQSVRVTAGSPGDGDTAGGVDLGLMGMRGELTILLDAVTGIPVELEGDTRHLGRITVRLERVMLREAPAPAEAS